jgi:tRNA (uracil-5-)-methyltransferase
VMGYLLTEYLGSPQQDIAASENNSEINDTSKNGDILDCSENNSEKVDSLIRKSDNGESQQLRDTSVDHPTYASDEEMKGNSVDRVKKEFDGSHGECHEADGERK